MTDVTTDPKRVKLSELTKVQGHSNTFTTDLKPPKGPTITEDGRLIFYLYSVDDMEYRVPILREVDVTPPTTQEIIDDLLLDEGFHQLIDDYTVAGVLVTQTPSVDAMDDGLFYIETTTTEPPRDSLLSRATLFDYGVTKLSNIYNRGNDLAITPGGVYEVIGDLSLLTTNARDNIVNAINSIKVETNQEFEDKIGDLADLDTTVKDSVVAGVNSIKSELQQSIENKIGDLGTLQTVNRDSAVSAVNEINAKMTLKANTSDIGALKNLQTEVNDNIVNAINSALSMARKADEIVKGLLGNIEDLTTDSALNAVDAINSVNTNSETALTNIGNLMTLQTSAKDNLVNAINSVYADTFMNSGVPIGTVLMFSGTIGGSENRHPIPPNSSSPDLNYVLCDGRSYNGMQVPDLRDRFIVGAGSSYSVKSTGGSNTHYHSYSSTTGYAGSHYHSFSGSVSGSVGSATLSVSQMPGHTHGYEYCRDYTGAIDTSTLRDSAFQVGPYVSGQVSTSTSGTWADTIKSTGGGSSHTHSLSSASFSGSTGSDGNHYHSYSGSTNSSDNRPLYYALYYIMKVR